MSNIVILVGSTRKGCIIGRPEKDEAYTLGKSIK